MPPVAAAPKIFVWRGSLRAPLTHVDAAGSLAQRPGGRFGGGSGGRKSGRYFRASAAQNVAS
jgi:uncharacterized membrane protein